MPSCATIILVEAEALRAPSIVQTDLAFWTGILNSKVAGAANTGQTDSARSHLLYRLGTPFFLARHIDYLPPSYAIDYGGSIMPRKWTREVVCLGGWKCMLDRSLRVNDRTCRLINPCYASLLPCLSSVKILFEAGCII